MAQPTPLQTLFDKLQDMPLFIATFRLEDTGDLEINAGGEQEELVQ